MFSAQSRSVEENDLELLQPIAENTIKQLQKFRLRNVKTQNLNMYKPMFLEDVTVLKLVQARRSTLLGVAGKEHTSFI